MHSSLTSLPKPLLDQLGAFSRLESLAKLARIAELALNRLRQQNNGQPYHVATGRQGLSLMLQCLNPDAPSEERTWGLQGFTLKANAWDGAWPAGLNTDTATPEELVELLAANPGEVMNMPPMVCFSIQGVASQAWSVMAVFDSSGKLETFSLLRVGPWRELQALPS